MKLTKKQQRELKPLVRAVAKAQSRFWTALGELEAAAGGEIDSQRDFCDYDSVLLSEVEDAVNYILQEDDNDEPE